MALPDLAPIQCRPWWYAQFAPLSTGANRPVVHSGCSVSEGNVACHPEQMRANAEQQMRAAGYWQKSAPLSLAAYTLARYTSSEVGNGTPEEKVAVAETAINRARGTRTSAGWYPNDDTQTGVVKLLLYRTPGASSYGWYGPIHSGTTSPYGRWASTNLDPGIDDILIADFVLGGGSEDFARGPIAQYGMEVRSIIPYPQTLVARVAQNNNEYWVGPLPGVDPWHTFLLFQDKSIAASSPTGQALVARGQAAVADPPQRPDWSLLPVCSALQAPPLAVAGIALAIGLGLAYAVATWIEPAWRGTKYHDLDTNPRVWEKYNQLEPWKH